MRLLATMPVRTRSARGLVPLDVVIDVLFDALLNDLHNLEAFWAVWALGLTCKEGAAAITDRVFYTLLYLRHRNGVVAGPLFRDGLGRFDLDLEATQPFFGNVGMIRRLGSSVVEDAVVIRTRFAKNCGDCAEFGAPGLSLPDEVGCFIGFLRALHHVTLQTFPLDLHPCEICGQSSYVSEKSPVSSAAYWKSIRGSEIDLSQFVCSARCASLALRKRSAELCYSDGELDPVVSRRRGGDLPAAALLKAALDRNIDVARRMRRSRGACHDITVRVLNVDVGLLFVASLLAELPVRHRRKLPSSTDFRNEPVFWLKAICAIRKVINKYPTSRLLTSTASSRFLDVLRDRVGSIF